MPDPLHMVVLLEVDGNVDEARVLALAEGPYRQRAILRLSDFGYRRPPGFTPRDQLDWPALASALHALTSALRSRIDAASGAGRVEVYVAGLAPLAAFYALGTQLDLRTEDVIVANQRKQEPGTWDLLRLAPSPGASDFFADPAVSSREVSESTGRPVVFISTQVAPEKVPRDALRALVKSAGADVAAIVPLVTVAPRVLDSSSTGACAFQLDVAFRDIAAAFPHRGGLTVAGPASLALFAGVATNPHQHLGPGTTIQLGEYAGGPYVTALTLPLAAGSAPVIPSDSASVLARGEAFRSFRAGVDVLRAHLTLPDIVVPAGLDPRAGRQDEVRQRVLAGLKSLQLGDQPEGDQFELRLLHGKMVVGHGLLHALVELDRSTLESLGQLFTLHEVVHDHQGISSNNYRGIGRSGVVLEEADFWADAFALSTSVAHYVKRNGAVGEERVAKATVSFIDAHLAAMRAFDLMELGARPAEMPERRVRRYLIWYLQRARAATLRTPADARLLFDARVAVELAPLRGRLDGRGDKIAVEPTPDCLLAFSVGGLVGRVPALPQNFDPSALLREVLAGDDAAVHSRMDYVVDQHRALLAPWAG